MSNTEKLDIACRQLATALMNPYAISRKELHEKRVREAWEQMKSTMTRRTKCYQ